MLIPIWVRAGAVLLIVSAAGWDLTRPRTISDGIEAGSPPRWSDYVPLLRREYPSMRYIGHAQVYRGGLDVYDCGRDRWMLIGPGRRFTPCTRQTFEKTSQLVMESLDAEGSQSMADAREAVQMWLSGG